MRLQLLALPVFVTMALAPALSPAWADEAAGVCAESDAHERALAAVTAHAILPLSAILQALGTAAEGTLIEVKIDCRDGRALYVLEIRTPEGRLVEITVDAVTGLIVPGDDG